MECTYQLDNISEAADWLLAAIGHQKVVALHGDMGAGKTTLTSALLRAMHSPDHAASPTFSIINQYLLTNGQKMLHMDWYRLKDEEEAIQAGVEDALYSGHLCLVEWPERAANLLPDDTLHVYLSLCGPDCRKITLSKGEF